MKRYRVALAAMLLSIFAATTACSDASEDSGNDSTTQDTMDEQQATERAEQIIHEAVDTMSPKPRLKKVGPDPVGACLARDNGGSDDRIQVMLSYQLTNVPGEDAKNLVRQARDNWVQRGYKFQSSDADWAKPFPTINMRTEPDDFWMDAITGVVDRDAGEGLATITVTSPCFAPNSESSASQADPAALTVAADTATTQDRALGHSSRIYEALGVQHQKAEVAHQGPRQVQFSEGVAVHHAWSTIPLTRAERDLAMRRAQAYLEEAGWAVRPLPTHFDDATAVLARNDEDGSIAQIASSESGSVRVAVTTPLSREVEST